MARIIDVSYTHTGKYDGCTCDRCGLWITNIFTVKFDDGLSFNFGMDCIEKIMKDNRVNEYGVKVMNKLLRDVKKAESELADYKSGKINEENDKTFEAAKYYCEYWRERTFEEYRAWMIETILPSRIAGKKKELKKFEKVNIRKIKE